MTEVTVLIPEPDAAKFTVPCEPAVIVNGTATLGAFGYSTFIEYWPGGRLGVVYVPSVFTKANPTG